MSAPLLVRWAYGEDEIKDHKDHKDHRDNKDSRDHRDNKEKVDTRVSLLSLSSLSSMPSLKKLLLITHFFLPRHHTKKAPQKGASFLRIFFRLVLCEILVEVWQGFKALVELVEAVALVRRVDSILRKTEAEQDRLDAEDVLEA